MKANNEYRFEFVAKASLLSVLLVLFAMFVVFSIVSFVRNNKIDDIQAEVNELQNVIEQKEFEIQCLELQQNDLITELENERSK